MKNNTSKQPSQRQLKVGEELRHILSSAFMRGDFYDPETRKAIEVTVSEVKISPDLHNATAYVMPLAGKDVDKIMRSLERLAPHLRHVISKKLSLRTVPRITFKIDSYFENSDKINNLFNDPTIKKDLE